MTRKDYVAIAAALARSRPDRHAAYAVAEGSARPFQAQWVEDRRRIADVLADDNPRFDRERFIAATEA